MIDQARKGMFSLMIKSRKLSLPTDIHLFDSMLASILLYGSEVRGCENVDIINQFQLKFCKMLLGLKQSMLSVMIYGELGITPLNISIQSRILNFWARIINGKQEKISVLLYKLLYELHKRDVFHSTWITYFHKSLDTFQTICYLNLISFKSKVKSIIHDHFVQSWKSKIFESSKCINY